MTKACELRLAGHDTNGYHEPMRRVLFSYGLVLVTPILTGAFVAVSAFAQTLALTPTESKMVATVYAENPQALDLLRQLVEINSGTKNLEGVRAVGKVLMPQFEALGFQVRWVPMDEVKRAGVLVARHPCPQAKSCGKRMLLLAHMDTVFEQDSPFQHYTVHGSTAAGPGTDDTKGGIVVMIYALKAMQAANVLRDTDITVVLSGDEEAHGDPIGISRRDMIDAAKHSDVALEFEATVLKDGLYYGSTSRRGAIDWRLETKGETGHSSQIFSPRMGAGAIYELTRIIDAFRTQLPEQYLTFNVGMVLGGGSAKINQQESGGEVTGKDNIVPPVAIALGDIRTLSNEQTDRVKAKMRAIVAQNLPGSTAKIEFGEGYPAMAPTEGNRALLKLLNNVNLSLGEPEMQELDPMLRGAGDIAFVAPYVPSLAGVGSSGSGDHSPAEMIDLPSQPLNTKRAALLMYRLSQLDAKAKLAGVAR